MICMLIRALSSPSLISLTSTDPILTAFKLSTQLRSLAKMEAQFCQVYFWVYMLYQL